MPSLIDFLQGFKIHRGLQLNGYLLTNIQGEHKQIVKYREYEYPLELMFIPQHPQVDARVLLNQLNEITHGTRIIYTSYGNPYECNFGIPEIAGIAPNGTVRIITVGHASRIFL